MWGTAIGPKRHRDQVRKSLDKAASAIEQFEISLSSAVLNEIRDVTEFPIGPDIFSIDPERNWPSGAPAPHPRTVVRALRLYSRGLQAFDTIPDETGAHSVEAVSKYLISGYVKKATGEFNDVQVSALIGSALGETYDETAHRMWRSRNFDQLHKGFSSLVELLFGIGIVAGES